MITSSRIVARALQSSVVVAIVFALVGTHPVRAARVGAASSATFYATTKQAFDNWSRTNYAPPPQTSTFPAGTASVAFYFRYSGAGPSSGYYVVIRKPHSATVVVAGWYRLSSGSGSRMVYLNAPDGAYPSGIYDVDLMIDEQRQATIAITIGGMPAVTVTSFYSATDAAINTYSNSNAKQPAQTRAFPAGTVDVNYFIAVSARYAAVAHMRYSVTLSEVGQGVLHTTKPGALVPSNISFSGNDLSTWAVNDTLTATGGFDNGSYTLVLLLNGTRAATTTFTVGG